MTATAAGSLRTEQLRQPDVITAAYTATVHAQTAILTTLQGTDLPGGVVVDFGTASAGDGGSPRAARPIARQPLRCPSDRSCSAGASSPLRGGYGRSRPRHRDEISGQDEAMAGPKVLPGRA